jgi:hypothetical protein
MDTKQQLALMGDISRMQDPNGQGVYPVVSPYAYAAAPGQPKYSAPQGGSVQGSGTVRVTSAAPDPAAAQRAAAGQAINQGYDSVIGTLDRILGDIPNQQNAANQQVDNLYGAQSGTVRGGYDRGIANLDNAKTELNTQTKKGLRDLADNIRQTFSSWDAMLGAQGAGDSSATGPDGQLSYALHKVQAQNQGDIIASEGQQLNQINLKRGDLDQQFNDQMNQLNTWKQNQVISIAQQFAQQRNQLDLQRAGATRDKLIALANADTNLVNQALSALQGVEQTHTQAIANINQSINAPSVNAAPLAQTNFQVQTPQGQGIPGMTVQGGQTGAPIAQAAVGAPKKQPWEL